jgi:hypothetical protein
VGALNLALPSAPLAKLANMLAVCWFFFGAVMSPPPASYVLAGNGTLMLITAMVASMPGKARTAGEPTRYVSLYS